MTPDYIWRKLSSESILRTPYYGVRVDRLMHPRGHELDYYVIDYSRAGVGVVVSDEAGRLLLVEQWRHPVGALTWSVPAGAIDEGETPDQAARREVREETGYAIDKVAPLYRYHPAIGTANQTFHLFVAKGAHKIAQHDPGEIRAVRWFARDEVEKLLSNNEMLDGMSLTAVLLWLRK